MCVCVSLAMAMDVCRPVMPLNQCALRLWCIELFIWTTQFCLMSLDCDNQFVCHRLSVVECYTTLVVLADGTHIVSFLHVIIISLSATGLWLLLCLWVCSFQIDRLREGFLVLPQTMIHRLFDFLFLFFFFKLDVLWYGINRIVISVWSDTKQMPMNASRAGTGAWFAVIENNRSDRSFTLAYTQFNELSGFNLTYLSISIRWLTARLIDRIFGYPDTIRVIAPIV